MKCKQARAALAVAPREWSEAERQQIDAHLLTCAACAAIARDYARQASQLTALPRTSMSMAQQQAILSQALRAPQRLWSRRLVNAFGAAVGMVIIGVLIVALLRAFNNPTSSAIATVASVMTPTPTATSTPAPPTFAPAVPPSPAPPPTVMLPNGAFATATPAPIEPIAATEFAAQEATRMSGHATEVARATQAPFPTSGLVVIQTGQPASASVQRGNLMLELRLPTDTYLAGEGGQAEVSVTNNGTEALFIRDADLVLLDAQGDEPQPWPWEPIVMIGGLPGRGWGSLTSGQILTRTLKFQLPPLEQMVGKSYQLGVALEFNRASIAFPESPDDIYLRAETGLIPLHVTAPTATQQLAASLELDWNGWHLHVTDADGHPPQGSVWGTIEALFSDGAMSGPLQENNDGQWSGQWDRSFTASGQNYIVMRAWIAAPGYVTAAVTRTLASDSTLSSVGSGQRFGMGEPPPRQTFASLEQAQAALNAAIYRPTHLPDGAVLADIVHWDSVSYDGQRHMNFVQTYRLPAEVSLILNQSTAEGYDAQLWGTARYAPDAQQMTIDDTTGYLIQRFGFRLLDWTVNDHALELRVPVSAVSTEELLGIAAEVQPLH
jgi:hypothetical protein